jgi:hypothetical protein
MNIQRISKAIAGGASSALTALGATYLIPDHPWWPTLAGFALGFVSVFFAPPNMPPQTDAQMAMGNYIPPADHGI